MAVTKAQQAQIDAAVSAAVSQAQKGLVSAVSKPEQITNLRNTWRKSAEHKAAQVKRFLFSLGGVVIATLISDVASGKNPMTHFTDVHTAWYFLLPFALVAWRQVHPSMTASQVDSAPGVTIVPDQVGAQTVDAPVSNATIQVPVSTDPTAGSVPLVPEGDAAP